jgi:hypothetical protein
MVMSPYKLNIFKGDVKHLNNQSTNRSSLTIHTVISCGLPAGYAIFFPQEYGPVGSLSVRAI